eukprot:gnl/Hemi2/21031_TR6980_c0_g1_i1.p1 gnl/Hemi2/21031_TR6980_c0_g1~~gnl/Hemi2/21031_TR6980_c0_g1_i1.p1  ORF type:complete len:500 (+),score=152.59 gnl/Hemi2/21031_TR6980_c0_g1_i1:74-1573(+)
MALALRPRWHAWLVLMGALVLSTAAAAPFHVQVISRHGDRMPIWPIPADTAPFPFALGQLTPTGMAQTFRLGQLLRGRLQGYGIINDTAGYRPATVHFRSSGLDRTLMSAQSITYGLYPPGTGWRDDDGEMPLPLGLQAVAVGSVLNNNPMDELLLRAVDVCPAFNARSSDFARSSEAKAVAAANAVLLANLTTWLQWAAPIDLINLPFVVDSLLIARLYGHMAAFPTIDNATFAHLSNLSNWMMSRTYSREIAGNLLGGPLMAQIRSDLSTACARAFGWQQYVHFSAHDVTILYTLGLLGLLDANTHDHPELRVMPPYASALAFELEGDAAAASTCAVRLVYRSGDQEDFVAYAIPGCSTDPCPLGEFLSLTAPLATTAATFCAQCGNTDSDQCRLAVESHRVHVATVWAAVSGGLLFFAVAAILWLLRDRRQRRAHLAAYKGVYQQPTDRLASRASVVEDGATDTALLPRAPSHAALPAVELQVIAAGDGAAPPAGL